MISSDKLTCKRPAFGISPIHWDEVIGKVAKCRLKKDSILEWEHIVNYEH